MDNSYFQQIAEELIDKNKWSGFLKRFIDVLWINICLVDTKGKTFIPPYQEGGRGRYGSQFLSSSFQFDFTGQSSGQDFLKEFVQYGAYLEAKDPFDFHTFVVPIKVDTDKVIAYLLVGPVILNKRWSNDDYLNVANQLNLRQETLIDSIHEIRVVSFVTIKAILDLLAKVVKDIVQLNYEKKQLRQSELDKEALPERIAEVAQDLYKTIHLNELLVTILDVALNLTKAECGSIMILDEMKNTLGIKVSRGLDRDKIRNSEIKMGEGIAGIAAQENKSFLISKDSVDNRIQHLLKRPEISKSAVVPLLSKGEILGVLNVHTHKQEDRIEENVENLKYVSKLISAAIESL